MDNDAARKQVSSVSISAVLACVRMTHQFKLIVVMYLRPFNRRTCHSAQLNISIYIYIQGRGAVCGVTRFRRDTSYTTIDPLDKARRELGTTQETHPLQSS